ncbi:hypothetical protein Tco_0891667 [Tanacetum coccineum]|uniref:Uncharacterized protein n=1 Tax=Tanacetum coccineum TaxID=301880 RepID=A0ABQ5C3K8_9ASTR
MDEDHVVEVSKQIDLNQEIIEQQNKVISDGSADVPEAKVADAVMEDVTGCETVIIRDKKPNDNRSLFHKKGKEQEKKTRTVAEAERDYKIESNVIQYNRPCDFCGISCDSN